MTAKNRQKSNAGGDKAPAAAPPAHKEEKSQKSNGVSGSAGGQGQARKPANQGSSGTPASKGNSGTPTPKGNSGTPSPKGNSGTQSPKGSSGTQSAKGNSGTQSPKGSSGTQSAKGSSGTQSAKGSSGTQSAKGSSGTQSAKGSSGTQSAKGSSGTQSAKGSSGTQAAQAQSRTPAKKSGGCLGTLVSVLFYGAMIAGAALAAFHLQKVVEEIRHTSAKHAESAQRSAELGGKMESVVQQVASLKGVVDSLESSMGATRVELKDAVVRMARGEEETRRLEEALQKLQKDLLKELAEGISEVKEARERDFSSLETTVEQRLEEVSRSVRSSVAEFTGAQGEAQSQLADLQARLGGIEDPAMVKQELAAIVEVVAEIRAAKQDADSTADSIREQINSVREELRTRSQEVASLSQEVESVRSVVQDTVGSLKLSVSATQTDVQALRDQTGPLLGGWEQAAEGVRDVERKLDEVAAQMQKRADDVEARLKASEESGESAVAKVESLLSQYDTQESAQVGKAPSERELEALSEHLEELRTNVAAVGEAQDSLATTDSLMAQRVEELERLAAEAGAENAAKLEEQQGAIASIQTALEEAARTLAALSEAAARAQE
ncbi:cytoskeleton-associated protein 4-like [Syngnathoides biaculeatus]|uniref:cytoskeleton-associated protein 4-like n=1 Tax=Syngnathoides biaculeatus TaxID=300417 RepID=UPI002ADDD150|nr:cytoskeleton-associated protein 4-like [Syngnathoides biaculeatus]